MSNQILFNSKIQRKRKKNQTQTIHYLSVFKIKLLVAAAKICPKTVAGRQFESLLIHVGARTVVAVIINPFLNRCVFSDVKLSSSFVLLEREENILKRTSETPPKC